MNCPVCDTRLREVTKYGVEVDICPDCKGVWLDRGELEKVIEMEAAGGPAAGPVPAPERLPRAEDRYDTAREQPYRREREDDDRDDDDRRDRHDRTYDDRRAQPHRKKRESWFGEIFDMFGGD